ncbi:MAG: rRNA maturation RNase YbeY [Deltaproteobacteria bacterium]|nr:rRNA maturation RNase YbeY [Deltaproteobacteria bacterium]
MADIWAEDRQSRLKINTENVAWFGEEVLDSLGRGGASVSVVVTDNSEIQRYNREYLGRDRPTNVISFPMNEGETIEGDNSYLGDVILSVDEAEREGRELGYTTEEMLLLYLIHGVLHLSGYDHEGVSEERAKEMEDKQMELLEKLIPFLKESPLISESA